MIVDIDRLVIIDHVLWCTSRGRVTSLAWGLWEAPSTSFCRQGQGRWEAEIVTSAQARRLVTSCLAAAQDTGWWFLVTLAGPDACKLTRDLHAIAASFPISLLF